MELREQFRDLDVKDMLGARTMTLEQISKLTGRHWNELGVLARAWGMPRRRGRIKGVTKLKKA